MTTSRTPVQRLFQIAERVKGWAKGPIGSRISQIFSIGFSLLILFLLVDSITTVGWDNIRAVLPANPLFWLFFVASYLSLPFFDWRIYRKWWKLSWKDISVFLKARVMNEALFSYSGHTYMLVWAAGRLGFTYDPQNPPPRLLGRGDGEGLDPAEHPLAAVKDMAITSGLAGNFVTLLMLLLAVSITGESVLSRSMDANTLRILLWSFGAMILLNIGILLFRGKVMSIPSGENIYALRWHLVRVLSGHILLVLTWIVALPAISFGTWFLLGALRMVIGRMPVPNKEILFATIAVGLTGDASVEVAALMAAQGALHLLCHGAAWFGAVAIDSSQKARVAA